MSENKAGINWYLSQLFSKKAIEHYFSIYISEKFQDLFLYLFFTLILKIAATTASMIHRLSLLQAFAMVSMGSAHHLHDPCHQGACNLKDAPVSYKYYTVRVGTVQLGVACLLGLKLLTTDNDCTYMHGEIWLGDALNWRPHYCACASCIGKNWVCFTLGLMTITTSLPLGSLVARSKI